ncbi:hypothetical protein SY83_17675 [Paenibacillus swuensis]|uniref:Uncharacterized protein n=1 Tax=Paenibacillus swuensis TaxID=1178515 RepID=A0A172TL81_9BACL|nr:STM3941 family protein [Paenibacillus swuensis]ANE47815.1 hypothetical protein SY83_17675 [Paenibacillus swuensis]
MNKAEEEESQEKNMQIKDPKVYYPNKGKEIFNFLVPAVLIVLGFWMIAKSDFSNFDIYTGVIPGIGVYAIMLYQHLKHRKNKMYQQYNSFFRNTVVPCSTFLIIIFGLETSNRTLVFILLSFPLIIFVASAGYRLYRMTRGYPSIIVSERGLLDRTSILNAAFVNWNDVQEIFTYVFMNRRTIGLVLSEPRFQTIPWINRFNHRILYKQRVFILTDLDVGSPMDKLYEEMNQAWEHRKEA